MVLSGFPDGGWSDGAVEGDKRDVASFPSLRNVVSCHLPVLSLVLTSLFDRHGIRLSGGVETQVSGIVAWGLDGRRMRRSPGGSKQASASKVQVWTSDVRREAGGYIGGGGGVCPASEPGGLMDISLSLGRFG